ncbi:hypothetical protein ACIH2S_19030 [Providencia sp. PAZ2]|uniref:O40 family O-antigen flippase n=1 Tax=Providencia lanzhouensis TaxID=3378099 RepID=UPI003D2E185E
MKENKTSNLKLAKLASYSGLSRLFKAISGPVILLIIGKKLSLEEISFYFTFFNLIAMQQLAELGIGHVIKLSIAHSFSHTEDKINFKIKSYFYFSILWFLAISIFIILFVGYGGNLFYSSYNGNVDWFYPWWCLVISSSLVSLLTPISLLLEGAQQQLILYKSQVISSIINPIMICISLYLDFGLYSISLGLIISNIFLYLILLPSFLKFLKKIKSCNVKVRLIEVFKELWPLLSKVSIVWGLGFIFWNGFNLIAFKTLSPIDAGKLIFTFTLAKAGFSIAESFTQSHMTYYSAQISQRKVNITYKSFLKYRKIALTILVLGYSFFLTLSHIMPDFYIFNKISNIYISLQIFLFFIFLLILTTNNNFIRCFKVEPFAVVSAYHSLICPLAFFFSCLFLPNAYFILPSVIILGSIYWSKKISYGYILQCRNDHDQ